MTRVIARASSNKQEAERSILTPAAAKVRPSASELHSLPSVVASIPHNVTACLPFQFIAWDTPALQVTARLSDQSLLRLFSRSLEISSGKLPLLLIFASIISLPKTLVSQVNVIDTFKHMNILGAITS